MGWRHRAAWRSRPPGKTRRRQIAGQPVDDRRRIEESRQRAASVVAPRRVERHQPGERAHRALAVALSPDGKRLAAANLLGEVRLWDTTSGEALGQGRERSL